MYRWALCTDAEAYLNCLIFPKYKKCNPLLFLCTCSYFLFVTPVIYVYEKHATKTSALRQRCLHQLDTHTHICIHMYMYLYTYICIHMYMYLSKTSALPQRCLHQLDTHTHTSNSTHTRPNLDLDVWEKNPQISQKIDQHPIHAKKNLCIIATLLLPSSPPYTSYLTALQEQRCLQ